MLDANLAAKHADGRSDALQWNAGTAERREYVRSAKPMNGTVAW
jgi:hypothetical protein